MASFPRTGSTQQVYWPNFPIALRDGTYDLVAALPDFKNVYKALSFPTQDQDLPFCAVVYGGERMSSEGQGNQSEPHFTSLVTICVSIVDKAGSALVIDGRMMPLAEKVKAALLRNPDWINLSEGIDSFTINVRYPQQGDAVYCEARMEIVAMFRSYWPPIEPNAFKELDVYTKLTDTQLDGAPPGTFGPEELKQQIIFSDS